MIDRVARVVSRAFFEVTDGAVLSQVEARAIAIAAFEEAREPSPPMIVAAIADGPFRMPEDWWRAMIDAALGEAA